ncbi:hypothetical protein BOTBODRAFT_548240 [Botryobasidium botryosum FD-172 SS1]|uniref:Uncharacterized protein n=1 Tax=Botryobasidium botryosum (strain FD-172 SS1) TaxID=930990 RepID=A0A067N2Q5_BOTB1|nr:hypothetical protein BOTBODRAFT_548240 [Botryobasidium botryosum FD-172 SS1]
MAAGSLAPPSRSTRGASLLPSVKCSTCALLVPLDELGDHVCAPLPPGSPALTATSGSTSSAASSQASLFSKITSMASTDSVNSRTRPLHKPSMSSSTEASSMSGSSRSSRALSSGSTSSRRPMRMPPPSGPIPPTPNSAQRPAGSPSPVPSFSQPHAALAQTLPRRQSPSIPRPPGSPPKEPLPPLPIPSSLTFSTDTRAPSPNRAPSPIPSSAFQVPFPRSPSPAPSFRGPSPTPSSALPSALMPGSASRGLPNNANSLFPRTDSSLPSPSSGRLSPSSPNSQHTSYFSTPPPSTEIGGEAGRAGVGRRAFHAVAHAAMFTGGIPQQHGNPLNQRRPPAPQFLDIGAIYGPGSY